jgi:1-aminocyclopropane-1-carboxylate deaminase/D-cysteine desulfhydrase-like pyridoxal-dependent ACC family enzyme
VGETISLFQRFPGLEGRLPRVPLGSFPTPVEPLRVPGAAQEVWVKRDDLTGRAYGGNKVRKLEFLLADARENGTERVITAGALGSHHALATTVYARQLGFPVTLVLSPQRPTPHVREVLLADHALGAELRLARRMELIPWGLFMARIRNLGSRPYVVPPGGSDGVGSLGYVNAALELVDQVEAGELPMPREVHVACGTMGTVAGLALGFALADAPIRVNGIRVVSSLVTNLRVLRKLLRSTASLLRSGGVEVPPLEAALELVRLRHDQFGGGYGKATQEGRRAMERLGSADFHLDATYTAKAAAGLLAALDEGMPGPHLYWHTLSHGMPPLPGSGIEVAAPGSLPPEFRSFFQEERAGGTRAEGGKPGPTGV